MIKYPSIAARKRLLVMLLFFIPLAMYVRTLAPSITWTNESADSGDLVTAAFTGGIPHPTGYPLYTMVASVLARLPFGEPAQNVAFFSALCAAAAVVLTYSAARAVMPADLRPEVSMLAAAAAALTLAFAPLFWAQANVAELYAPNALLVAALLAVLLSQNPHRLELAALIFGVGLAHHLSILLFAPTVALLLSAHSWRREQIARAAILFFVPLLFYLYLPIRAAAQPPVNWGDPKTLAGFLWTVSAAPYRVYFFDFQLGDAAARLAMLSNYLFRQFAVWGVALGLWGLVRMFSGETRRRLAALILAFFLPAGYAIAYASRNSFVYLLPAFIVFALWLARGIAELTRMLPVHGSRVALIAAVILLPGFNLAANFSALDLSRDHQAIDYAAAVFRAAPRDALIVTDGDAHLFALWYYRYVRAPDARVAVVSREMLQYDWYYDQVQRTMPELPDKSVVPSLAQRLQEVIEQNLRRGRAVYATTQDEWFTAYSMKNLGALYQIVGRLQ
jgi:hypothetical protein